MAFTEALRLLIDADTRGAVRGIEQVGAATDKSLGKSQRTIEKWGRGLTVAGASMVALGGAALFGLGKAAMASEEAELGFRKLQNSIANNPRLAAESAVAFRDLAESIQDKTAADADAIVAGQAVLAQRKLDAAQIKELTPLIVDLARKKGIDEVAAFTLASKAVDGNAGALKRAGISIDEAAFKSDAFGATVDALRSSVGGFAEEEGKTFAGSLERLKNQMGDVVEGVGTGAVDAFSSLFSVVEGGLDKFEELSPATQSAIGKFATFGSVALIAAGGVSFMIGQLLTMTERFKAAQAAAAAFAGSGGLGRLARVSLVIGGFVALREVLMAMEDDLEGIDVAKLENQLLDLAETGKLSAGQLKDVFTEFQDAIESGDPQAIERMADRLGEVDKALAQLASRDPEAAAASFRHITDRLREMGASSGQIKAFFDDYAAATANADTASRTAKGGVDELAGGLEDEAGAADEATSALQEYSDQLKAMTDPIFAAMDAITGVRDAQLGEADAAAAVMEAHAALNEARAGGNEAEIAEAVRNLEDAQRELSDAQWATVESAAEADSALAGLKDAVATGDVSMAAFKDTLATWVAQGFLTQAQADAAAASVANLGGQAAEADKERVDIPVTTPGAPEGRVRLTQVRDAAHDVPRRTSTHVGVSGAGSAISLLNSVSTRIRQLDGSTATVRVNARMTSTGRIGGVPVFQHGGVADWQRGEHRLAMIAGGETVLPTHQTGVSMGRAAASGYVDNRVFNITTGADPHSVVRAIRQAGDLGLPITIRGRRL
jgi:hypothetical protein